jgi:hypothetical protein
VAIAFQILKMESLILNTFSFRLAVVTPKHFLKRFTTAAGASDVEIHLTNVRRLMKHRKMFSQPT